MCLQCHSTFNNDDLYVELTEIQQNPSFDVWNTTSLNHLFIAATEYNGKENADLAILLLEQYVEWYKTQKYECYLPTNSLEPMPSIGYMERSIAFLKTCEKTKSIEQLLTDMHNFATCNLDAIIRHYMAKQDLNLQNKYKIIYFILVLHCFWKTLKNNIIKFCKLVYGFMQL